MSTDQTQCHGDITSESIHSKQVHVWAVCLDVTVLWLERLFTYLSADEIARADRFQFEKDRKRFIVARGMLRQLLGCYLGVKPSKIQFEYTPHGKPMLAPGLNKSFLNFNLSHAGTFALYAITSDRNIGVDIERVRPDLAVEQIAHRFFSPAEIHSLDQTPDGKRNEVFFQYWSRKEAFLKATGKGLLFPMQQFDVSHLCSTVLSPISFIENKAQSTLWYGIDLPFNGYTAAVVVEGSESKIDFNTMLLSP